MNIIRDLRVGDRIKFICNIKDLENIGIDSDAPRILRNPYGVVSRLDIDSEQVVIESIATSNLYYYSLFMLEPTNRRDI